MTRVIQILDSSIMRAHGFRDYRFALVAADGEILMAYKTEREALAAQRRFPR